MPVIPVPDMPIPQSSTFQDPKSHTRQTRGDRSGQSKMLAGRWLSRSLERRVGTDLPVNG
jgi:hypothetical protein